MTYEQITVEKRGRVSLLTLNRPEKLNAWTPQMMSELTRAMREAAADNAIGAIVVTGSGRAFCAGADMDADVRAHGEPRDSGDTATAAAPAEASSWVTCLPSLPKPTIAAVNGTAVGIGVTHVLPMDIRSASESAR